MRLLDFLEQMPLQDQTLMYSSESLKWLPEMLDGLSTRSCFG